MIKMVDLVQGWRQWLQRQGHASLRAATSRGCASVRTTAAMSAKQRASMVGIAEASAAAASAQSTVFEWSLLFQISCLSVEVDTDESFMGVVIYNKSCHCCFV